MTVDRFYRASHGRPADGQALQAATPMPRRAAARALFVVGAWFLCALPSAGASRIIITSRANIFIDAREPQPVQRAAQDLAKDFGKVFGKPAEIVHDPNWASRTTLWISDEYNLPAGVQKPSGWERLSIQAATNPWPNPPAGQGIVLTGSDMRGTIFAIYQFSRQFLGVDPFYWWTDHQPARRVSISIPDNFSETQGPTFHYRGFFINDEDLLTGWAPGKKGEGTGISLEVWNKVFETILRLKGNMVAPGTWIFSNEPQIKLAGQRGLILTQHHAIPLGLNVARWPENVPYSYSSHPEILEQAWKNAVAGYPADQEVLWTVGLRGLSDASYAAFDPSVRGDNHALGHLIGAAIADQMRIVRAVHSDAQFITSLWQEGARLVQSGDLSIPPEVHAVWADDGYGYLQDHGQVAAGQGAYDHVAMMNARANQLSEMVPVERIVSELGRYIHAGATHYLLLNTSDIRPVSMTTRAVMDIAWKGLPPDAAGESDAFYRRWSSEEFGGKAADQVAAVYKDYFAAPAQFSFGAAPAPAREYGDNYYHTQARTLMLAYMIDAPLYSIPSQSPTWVTPRIFGNGGNGGIGGSGAPAATIGLVRR